MARATPIITNFTAGELTPQLDGRVDVSKYHNGARLMRNMTAKAQGGATRRVGLRFVQAAKSAASGARLMPFEFSTEQAYIIEMGNLYARFYKDEGRIEDPPTTPVEIVTPYAVADLPRLRFTQSADVLYLVHQGYEPRKLSRTSDIAWTITIIDFVDGPYLDVNLDATKLLKVNGGSYAIGDSVTLTATGHTPFVAAHVGSLWRLESGSNNAWVKVTAFTNSSNMTVTVRKAVPAPLQNTNTATWREGAWSAVQGYPACVCFFQQRLTFGGPTQHPTRLDASRSESFEDFTPGTADDDPLSFTIATTKVNAIRWMMPAETLQIGTTGGEFLMRASSQGEAVTPTNVQVVPQTEYGSADHQPLRVASATLFLQRSKTKLRELAFSFEADQFVAPDLTLLAEHMPEVGIDEIVYQQEPDSVVWARRFDGRLLGMTYQRDQDVVAWHQHPMTNGSIESLAVIPAPFGAPHDQLWALVRRTINGASVLYVEVMTQPFTETISPIDIFFVDGGLFADLGEPFTTIIGLDHLEGETVDILADGAVHPSRVVVGGQITLQYGASVLAIGLPYVSDLEPMRIEAGSQDGTAQGKRKRIHALVVRLWRSLGMKIGPDANSLTPVYFRTSDDPMNEAPAFFSGDKRTLFRGGYRRKGTMLIRQDQPLPLTVLAIIPQLVTNDL